MGKIIIPIIETLNMSTIINSTRDLAKKSKENTFLEKQTINKSLQQGSAVTASGDFSSAHGVSTIANGIASVAEGYRTFAGKHFSRASGKETSAGFLPFVIEEIALDRLSFTISGNKIAAFQDLNYPNETGYVSPILIYSRLEFDGPETPEERYDILYSTAFRGICSVFIDTINTPTYDSNSDITTVFLSDPLDEKASTVFFTYTLEWLFKHFPEKFAYEPWYSSVASNSSAEGWRVIAGGPFSHAEGVETFTIGEYSHAEGLKTVAAGNCSHAEGGENWNAGNYSHVEGNSNYIAVNSNNSHVEGVGNIAIGLTQHIQGKYNQPIEDARMLIGNGTSNEARSNILEVYDDSIKVKGDLTVTNLENSSTRAVYADSSGKLTIINNTYTYDTVNTNATYKITISGSHGNVTSGLFFTTDPNKGKFIPYNCMFLPTSGDLSAAPDISVGLFGEDGGFDFNDIAVNNSVPNMVIGTEFVEIPLQTPNGLGAGRCKAVAPSTQVGWRTQGLFIGTQITGTIVLSGYYLGV